jgi:hypothetical protein
MKMPLRRNRWKIPTAASGEFRARAARKSDDTTKKVQRRAGGIGLPLNAAITMLAWTQVSLILLIIIATVVLSEWV